MKTVHKTQKCRYYVEGMHCSSCEILIEKKLKKLENIHAVNASLSRGEIDIEFSGKSPDPKLIDQMFLDNGYTFSLNPKSAPPLHFLFKFAEGRLIFSKSGLFSAFKGSFLILLILMGVLLIDGSKLGGYISISNTSSLPTFFIFGLIAGISSCAALVGGLLLSVSRNWSDMYIDQDTFWKRSIPFILFNLGRLIAFALLGGLLGYLGLNLGFGFVLKPAVTAVVISLISIYMLILGMGLLGFDFVKKLRLSLPKRITSKIVSMEDLKGKYVPFVVGLLTFFLPCGFTLNAQAIALTSGSVLDSMLMMLFFALGTLPILLLISFSSVKIAQNPKLNATFNFVAGVVVVIFAVYNFNAQLNVLGLPSFSDFKVKSVGNSYTSIINDSTQLLKTTATSEGYSPSEVIVKADVPIDWEITDTGASGCTNAIISTQLLGDKRVTLVPGVNSVKLPALKAGVYKYSCWMGMYQGVIKAI
ncbi:sulfite exporter TauE/SafE family protein [bacterium]|nr:sulfite exporter TauE/SafE family protein [bacterium]